MRRIVTVLTIIVAALWVSAAWADPYGVEKSEKQQGICPYTKMTEACLSCHVRPNFKIKEAKEDAWRDYPVTDMEIVDGVAYYFIDGSIGGATASSVEKVLQYATENECERVVFEIHSGGGSLLDAWRVVGWLNAYRPAIVIETRCYGFAASAAFLIFASGDMGSRYVSPTAELMWHELWTFKMLSIETPSKSEDEAEVLRHLQDTTNSWLSGRCNLTKKELDAKVHKQEWWMNGVEAMEAGIADHVLGD